MTKISIPIKTLSVNEAWKGRRFKTDKYRAFQKHLLLMLRPLEVPPPPFGVRFEFGFSNSLSDIDNPVKMVMDILCKKYGFDDRHVYRMEVDKVYVHLGDEYLEFEMFPLPVDIMLRQERKPKKQLDGGFREMFEEREANGRSPFQYGKGEQRP